MNRAATEVHEDDPAVLVLAVRGHVQQRLPGVLAGRGDLLALARLLVPPGNPRGPRAVQSPLTSVVRNEVSRETAAGSHLRTRPVWSPALPPSWPLCSARRGDSGIRRAADDPTNGVRCSRVLRRRARRPDPCRSAGADRSPANLIHPVLVLAVRGSPLRAPIRPARYLQTTRAHHRRFSPYARGKRCFT